MLCICNLFVRYFSVTGMEEFATTGEQAAVSIMEKRLYSGGALTIKQEAPESVLTDHIFLPPTRNDSTTTVAAAAAAAAAAFQMGIRSTTGCAGIGGMGSIGGGGGMDLGVSGTGVGIGTTGAGAKRTARAAHNATRKCQVCEEPASGNFFGALVCLPCKVSNLHSL